MVDTPRSAIRALSAQIRLEKSRERVAQLEAQILAWEELDRDLEEKEVQVQRELDEKQRTEAQSRDQADKLEQLRELEKSSMRDSSHWPDYVRRFKDVPVVVGGSSEDPDSIKLAPNASPERQNNPEALLAALKDRPASSSASSTASSSSSTSLSGSVKRLSPAELPTPSESPLSLSSSAGPRVPRTGELRDVSTPAQQLHSVLKLTNPSLCHRGWRCWATESPCNGRMAAHLAVVNVSKTGTTVVRARRAQLEGLHTGPSSSAPYVHRARDTIDPADPRTQMEYLAASIYLREFESNPSVGRRSDELLRGLDEYVDSMLEEHPARRVALDSSASEEAKRLCAYLSTEGGSAPLRVSHGVLLAAAIYHQLFTPSALDADHRVPWVPVHVEDPGCIAIVSMPPVPSADSVARTRGNPLTSPGRQEAASLSESQREASPRKPARKGSGVLSRVASSNRLLSTVFASVDGSSGAKP